MVQVSLLGQKKKMVLIDSPSAATWTQFAALGDGVGGLCYCWKKTKTDGGWDPEAWDLWLHPACSLSWALGHLPMPGSPRGDAPALQKCWNRHIWRVKKRFSQQRLFPASGSEPSITSQAAPEPRRAGLEAAQSPGQWSQARGGEDEGVGRWDRGAAGRPVSAVLQAGPWGSRE